MSGASSNVLFKKCCIIGLGLIGGSLGMALGRAGAVEERWGIDVNERTMNEAVERSAVDRAAGPMEALKEADLVVLALPVGKTVKMLQEIAPLLKPGVLVTDVGSTKAEVVRAMEQFLPPGVEPIGGHPMAGSEQAGISAADPLLLENAVYLLTPSSRTAEDTVQKMKGLIASIRATPLVLSPEEHDELLGLTSHLPHLVAAALVNALKRAGESAGEKVLMLTGGGFRDTTRIAMGNPEVWCDIFSSNRFFLKRHLEVFRAELDRLAECLDDGAMEDAAFLLREARDFRSSLPLRGKGLFPGAYELIVLLPDVPGVLGKLTTVLGEAGLNISEIEILRVREEEEGSIRLGFHCAREREKAFGLLFQSGYNVWKKR